MSDDGDQSDNGKAGASYYSVGYKRPPPQHRFQKGRSGNPRGRPPRRRGEHAVASALDAEALMLHEAYRLVSIREGDRIIQMPAIQAVMRGLGVSAMKGNHRAQLAFKKMTETIEAKHHAEKMALFEAAVEYKQRWEATFAKCDKNNLPRPDPIPHPDDLWIDAMRGEVRIIGPFDEGAKKRWERMQASKQESLLEIEELQKMLKRKPEFRKFIEDDIAHEKQLAAIIDYHLPDEATRRSPFYDPEEPRRIPDRPGRHSRDKAIMSARRPRRKPDS